MQSFDIAVHGSGAVGLAAALALAHQGLSVALHAQAHDPRRDVAREDLRAFALNARSVALLESIKVWHALPEQARTPVHDMRVEGDAAGAALDFSAWQQRVTQLAWIVDASALEATLREAVRFAPKVSSLPRDAESAATLRLCRRPRLASAQASGRGHAAARLRATRHRRTPGR